MVFVFAMQKFHGAGGLMESIRMLGWTDADEAKNVLKEVSPKIKLWEQRNKIPDAIGHAELAKGEAPWDWTDRQYKDSDKIGTEESESDTEADEKEMKKKAKAEMSKAPAESAVEAVSPVFDDADVCTKLNIALSDRLFLSVRSRMSVSYGKP
jgi:hypothetical protein